MQLVLLAMDVVSLEDRLMRRVWLVVRRWEWVVDRWRRWVGQRAMLRSEEERVGGQQLGQQRKQQDGW